jgi:predicted nucleotide-binding protein
MNETARQQLETYVAEASGFSDTWQVNQWSKRVAMFLREALGVEESTRFRSLKSENEFDELALRCGHLEGLIAREGGPVQLHSTDASVGHATDAPETRSSDRQVFLVHGHDGEVKETVARFLEKLDLEPIILHEQANKGRTIIEKFEVSSKDVAFAVVLLTPDDIGCSAAKPTDLQPRARQNVILELGYFVGRLTRTRVCALHKGGVELPSDFQGIVYIEFDSAGAWRAKLAQEFVEAKLTINLEGLINR